MAVRAVIAMIPEKDIVSAFGDDIIAEFAERLKLKKDVLTRFGENTRKAVRSYFDVFNRPNLGKIENQIKELFSLTEKVLITRKSRDTARRVEEAAALLADRIARLIKLRVTGLSDVCIVQ
jgi:hypothetical protein